MKLSLGTAHIYLKSNEEAAKFVSLLTRENSNDTYVLENYDGTYRVNAKSLLGVLYFISEFNQEMYLVNLTSSELPNFIKDFM